MRFMPERKPPPKPWPMKWIVIAIIVCIVPYTWITLRHRKPGPAYLPYADNKARAEVLRLLDAGYRRFMQPVAPADANASLEAVPAGVSEQPGGMPPFLEEVLLDPLALPASVKLVGARTGSSLSEPLRIAFLVEASVPVAQAAIFVRNEDVTLAPVLSGTASHSAEKTQSPVMVIELPAGTLGPGTYRFTLLSEQTNLSWPVTLAEEPALRK